MNPMHGLQVVNDRRHRVIDRIKALNPTLANDLTNFDIEWYRIKNVANTETTEVFIYDEIDWFWGISADDLVRELNDISTPNIDIRLNSPGGSVFDCIAIYNALVKHPANITVYVDSLAASGASIIAMAGDKCIMMVGSQMMIHDALGIEMGNAADMRAYGDFLDRQSDNIASVYADKAGGEVAEWRTRMVAETWLFADEAVELGLADEIYTRPAPESADEPAEGSPEEEGEESPDEEEKEQEDPNAPVVPVAPENLLPRSHRLTNRGFKYPGRTKAPNPLDDHSSYVNDLIDNMFAERK